MSIFGEIYINSAINKAVAQIRREKGAYTRAAGKMKADNESKTDNIGNDSTDISSPNASNPENRKLSKKEKRKAKQIERAEREAPVEPIGTEKINNNNTVQPGNHSNENIPASQSTNQNVNIDAAMGGMVNPVQEDPYDLGIHINYNEMFSNDGERNLFDMNSVNLPQDQNIYANRLYGIKQPQDQFGFAQSQFIPQQPQQQNNLPMVVNNPAVPFAGFGRHRVDQPKPVVEKPVKNPPDNVDISGMPNLTQAMDITDFRKKDVRMMGVVETNPSIEVTEPPKPIETIFNNEPMFSEYPYLKEIQAIANKNGYQISFMKRPDNTGLINCFVCDQKGVPIPRKGFTIDTGSIIDRRKKIFPCIQQYYEGVNPYHLFKKPDGKGKDALNDEIITELIQSGCTTARPMYTDDIVNLNAYVALITCPANKQDRQYVYGRLLELYKDGTLSEKLATMNHARFRVAEYIKNSGIILLSTAGVPINYGGDYYQNPPMQLKISKSKVKTLVGDALIPDNSKEGLEEVDD